MNNDLLELKDLLCEMPSLTKHSKNIDISHVHKYISEAVILTSYTFLTLYLEIFDLVFWPSCIGRDCSLIQCKAAQTIQPWGRMPSVAESWYVRLCSLVGPLPPPVTPNRQKACVREPGCTHHSSALTSDLRSHFWYPPSCISNWAMLCALLDSVYVNAEPGGFCSWNVRGMVCDLPVHPWTLYSIALGFSHLASQVRVWVGNVTVPGYCLLVLCGCG